MRTTMLGAAIGALVLLAPEANAENGRATERPRMVQVERYPNAPLLATGALIFATAYGTGLAVAATSSREDDKNLYIPAAGPWLDIADRGRCRLSDVACNTENTERGLLIAMGVAQGAGLVMAIAALFVPERNLVERVIVTPVAHRGGAGIGLSGRF